MAGEGILGGIISGVMDSLSAIRTAGGFNFDVYNVDEAASMPTKFPTVHVVLSEDTNPGDFDFGGNTLIRPTAILDVAGWIQTRTNLDPRMRLMRDDIRSAMAANTSQGGIAHDTIYRGCTYYRIDLDQGIGASVCRFQIPFFEELADPTANG